MNRIIVGPRPVHLYVIDQTKQFWSHSDATGIFWAIPVVQPVANMVATPLTVSFPAGLSPGNSDCTVCTCADVPCFQGVNYINRGDD